ncbi:J domain-containing protein [Dermatobacter hominis]|uniref:J domain-containing protein n=1 Tax=Dermatobacter hominis TaxID=2884263 RepID=UPI001D0FC619|nr:DnaJ domain-containing protein [Dermatobacter hominis]UDY36487.1 DnaJ domain-containing protein [Dermatobacter hominis]
MQVDEARRVLGLAPDAEIDAVAVRASYRRLVRTAHPDVSSHPDAAARTARLTLAYRVLSQALATGAPTRGAPPRPPTPPAARPGSRPAPTPRPGPPTPPRPRIGVRLLDDESIAVEAPAEETLMLLLDTAHSLGEISYLDRTAGLVEVIVEFVEAPTSSVLFSLQGRANGTTEVFCTVEPLSGGEAPPADAVTRLVLATLRDEQG